MSEEKKKGGFWASLFGRNKKQEEQKIEPIIEEPSVEPADVSPEEEIVHAEEVVVEHLEPIVEQVISPESAVNVEPVLDTPVIETIDEETVKTEEISTALPTEEPTESIIEPDNVIEDLPVVEAEIESEIVDDVKDELRSDINTETQEKPSEGGFSAV